MSFTNEKWHNHLLAALTTIEWDRWLTAIETVHLTAGDVICEVGEKFKYVYFPTSSILSLTQLLTEGDSIEIAMVGLEGMIGVSILLGTGRSTQRVVVLRTGTTYRVKSSWFTEALKDTTLFKQKILGFTQSLITQISQVGACNRHHSLDQQFTRWLLSYADRANSDSVECTQETIAQMLGVRRERVAMAANKFQKNGYIQYSRGKITLIDRAVLEQQTCECYAVMKFECDQLEALH